VQRQLAATVNPRAPFSGSPQCVCNSGEMLQTQNLRQKVSENAISGWKARGSTSR
jgi:hypothetical protein